MQAFNSIWQLRKSEWLPPDCDTDACSPGTTCPPHKDPRGAIWFRTCARALCPLAGSPRMEGGALVQALEATCSAKPPGSPGFRVRRSRDERKAVSHPHLGSYCNLHHRQLLSGVLSHVTLRTAQVCCFPRDWGGDRLYPMGAETPGFSRSIPKGQVLGLPLAFAPDGLGQLCPPQLRSTDTRPSAGTGVLRLISPDSRRQTSQDVFTWSGESLSLPRAPFYATTEQDGELGQYACTEPGTPCTDW